MADFIRVTRVYESAYSGERTEKWTLVNLDHVRQFLPKNHANEPATAYIRWNAPDVPDMEIAEQWAVIETTIGARRVLGP